MTRLKTYNINQVTSTKLCCKATIGGALAQSNINPNDDLVLSKRIHLLKSLRALWSGILRLVFSACAAEPASGNFKDGSLHEGLSLT